VTDRGERGRRPEARELSARRAEGLSAEAADSLRRRGVVLYREVPTGAGEARLFPRARRRLYSAKVLDGDSAFLCEAALLDASPGGLRLRLARNVGLPPRFGVFDDQTGEVCTVSQVWRRGQTVGVRIHDREPPRPLRPVDKAALLGRYYGVRD
jgi:hypothetical protein